ncbi:MAG: LysR family transcriptional regulator [Gammaproteobacteria bacterium]
MNWNWNDVRYLLAAARAGTLAGAAKATRVDATTVARRLAAIERALGSCLFERLDGRLVPTAAGQAALRHAADAERALREIEAVSAGVEGEPGGTVRVSAVGSLLSHYLLPRLHAFTARWPGLTLELIADTAHADLMQREADLALRMVRPEAGSLVARRLARVGYAAYAQARLAHTLSADPATWPWIAYEHRFEHLPEAQWRRRLAGPARIALRTTVGAATFDAARAGLGVAVLPCYAADSVDAGLQRLTDPVTLREVWLVAERRERRLAPVRTAHTWLAEQFERDRSLFDGRAAAR